MGTLPFNPLDLVACDPARNIRQRWCVQASCDLFGRLVVKTCWGWMPTAGAGAQLPQRGSGVALHNGLMARRATAPPRIALAIGR